MVDNYRTVKRVVAVLNLIASSPRPLRLTEIATTADIPLSSAHLLLQELVKCGVVQRVHEREYDLGHELLGLSVRVLRRINLLDLARPVMRRLVERTGQDVFLAIPSGDSMMYVERINGPHSLRLEIPMGVARAVHSTAIGQLYLAHLTPRRAEAIIESADLFRFTSHTITEPQRILKRLGQVRSRGVAITDQESVDGIVGIAAPIYGEGREMVGALSLSVFRTVGLSKKEEFAEELRTSCAMLSAHLESNRSTPVSSGESDMA